MSGTWPPRGSGSNGRGPRRRPGLGLFQIAIGRRDGFADFGTTGEAYLASLAPLLAFAIVLNAVVAAGGMLHLAALGLLTAVCAILAPAVASHALCKYWGRAERWALYANVLNWGRMLMALLAALCGMVGEVFVAAGVPVKIVAVLLFLALVGYELWFQWFVARGTVDASRWKTLLLVSVVLLATYLPLVPSFFVDVPVRDVPGKVAPDKTGPDGAAPSKPAPGNDTPGKAAPADTSEHA